MYLCCDEVRVFISSVVFALSGMDAPAMVGSAVYLAMGSPKVGSATHFLGQCGSCGCVSIR